MKANYLKLVPFLIKWEGGIVNDPDDSGGLTNCGITFTTYKGLCFSVYGCDPSIDHFKNLTKDEVSLVVKYFWDKSTNNNTINSQMISEVAITWMWGTGKVGLIEFQDFLNSTYRTKLVKDGIIGAKTVNEINSLIIQGKELEMFILFCNWREQFFKDLCERIPKNKKFLKGWINRLNSFRKRHIIPPSG